MNAKDALKRILHYTGLLAPARKAWAWWKLRNAVPATDISAPAVNAGDPYVLWLREKVAARRTRLRVRSKPGRFSLLTSVYERTPPALFRETAAAVFHQTAPGFEWVLLAHGPIPQELDATLIQTASDPRVKLLRLEQNLGIIGGVRYCLEAAQGEYVIPLDADDLLLPDALQVLEQAIVDRDSPAFLYSDEDFLVHGEPRSPYLRPDWDPVLNLTSSYIWHACAFRKDIAQELDVYTDADSNWCHDWDTVFRFANAGHVPVHVPEVLYHWRTHDNSSTNTADPNRGSLASQRHVIERQISRQSKPGLYDIQPFPIFRGSQEWWIERRPVQPEPMELIYWLDRFAGVESPEQSLESLSRWLDETRYPFRTIHLLGLPELPAATRDNLLQQLNRLGSEHRLPAVTNDAIRCAPNSGIAGLAAVTPHLQDGKTVLCAAGLTPEGQTWTWEALRMFAFHDDLAVIAGRIVNPDNIVIGGGEVFGYGGINGCVEHARSANDPGPFAIFLKQRTVSAANSSFCIARSAFLRRAMTRIRTQSSPEFLGAWLGAIAAEDQCRVATSPLISARARPGLEVASSPRPEEQAAFLNRYRGLVEQRRWYSPHLSSQVGQAYELRAA